MSEFNVQIEKPRKPRRFIGRILLLFCFVAMVVWGGNTIMRQYAPVDSQDRSQIDVVIPERSTATQVAEILDDNNLIHNKTVFLAYCRKNGYTSMLKAGHYQLSRSQSLPEIVQAIASGKVVNISFTIPEGYTVDQIKNLLVTKGICSADEWDKAVQEEYNFEFLNDIPIGKTNRLEGFLFPDTYSISEDCSCRQIIEFMLRNFEGVWKNNFEQQAREQELSVYDTIILASMIEKEALVPNERPVIAGVIANRLKIGMLLQIDATVLYALEKHKELVTYADLEVDSPYNTYKYGGLPPGPIACPGKASIHAALNPQQHSYYYYVAKGDGSHYFSKTYDEHLRAIRQYGP